VILSSAVASGVITALQAWPDFFGKDPGDPGAGTDTPGFELERATPESFAADMAAMVRASSRVTLREPPEARPAVPPPGPQHAYVPDLEWT
jgi:hypothetical protein